MTRSTGAVGSLELLAGRARAGDRRAAAQLRKRMSPQVRELAHALSADPRAVPMIVRHALNDALADERRPYTWALVAAVQRRSAAVRGRTGARHARTSEKRLLAAIGVLCDMQGHTHSSAAALLGEPVARVAELHAQGRSDLGVDRSRTHCRGWHLVSRLDDLTPPEQAAGRRHLESCRSCEEALSARAAARLRIKAALPVGGTVLGGGIVAVFAAVGGGSASVGAAAVGAAAVLGTAGTVAVAVPPAPPAAPPPATVAPAEVERAEQPEPAAPVENAPAPAAPELAPAPPAPTPPTVLAPGGPAPRPTPAPTTAPPAPPAPTVGPALPLPELPLPLLTEPLPLLDQPLLNEPLPLPTSIPLPNLRPPLSVEPDKAKERCPEAVEPAVEQADATAQAGAERGKPAKRCDDGLLILPAAPLEVLDEQLGHSLDRLRDLREPRPRVSREATPWSQPAR